MKKILITVLVNLILVLSVTEQAAAADTQAPILISWKLLDEKADISFAPAQVRVEYSISDDSGVELPIVSLNSASTTQSTGLSLPELVSKVGNVSTYRATATFSLGRATGIWNWVLVPLRDSLGNSTMGMGPGGNWPTSVWVYDKDFTEANRLAAEKLAADKIAAQAIQLAQQALDQATATADAASAAKAAKTAKIKMIVITCVKGKAIKRVTGAAPHCPGGYKKK